MSDQNSFTLQALPDGGVEVRLVSRLSWEDLEALGRGAGRLAAQWHRPVSLDEAAVHALRSWSAAAAPAAPATVPAPARLVAAVAPATEPPGKSGGETAVAPAAGPLTVGRPAGQARQMVQHSNSSAPAPAAAIASPPAGAVTVALAAEHDGQRSAAVPPAPPEAATNPVGPPTAQTAGQAGAIG